MTTLFHNAGVPTVPPIDAPEPPKKRSWLPLLTVLFLISYALMTMLIVEQGATIESQRALIRELFRASTELTSMKKAQQETRVADPQRHGQNPAAKTPSSQANPSSQTPLTQTPSTQAPAKQAPSSQAAPQRRATNQNEQKKQFQVPPAQGSDIADERRELRSI